MFDLFNQPPDNFNKYDFTSFNRTSSEIEGLIYVPNFITESEEHNLTNSINNEPWLSDIKRRVQHYGYQYDYKARTINYSMFLGDLPDWSMIIAQRLFKRNYVEDFPDQLIVNEYQPGQGITNHVDCEPCFGETITSISLNSYCIMDFVNIINKQKIEIMMEPRSLVVIHGPARHMWTHGIAQRKADHVNGIKYDRQLRISLTFRKVILR
jgi:alkylated DNA repair dioxygenase AlkB